MYRRPRNALIAALLCTLGLLVTGAIALLVPSAKTHDDTSLAGFVSLGHPGVVSWANRIANLVDPNPYTIIAFVVLGIGLLRRRPLTAIVVSLGMGAAPLTTEILKRLVAAPRFSLWLGADGEQLSSSWPSGHATAAMMVALSAVIVAPRVARVFVALAGTVLATAVSYSVLVLGWHFPSDVPGGFLVAGLWTSLELAFLRWSYQRWPQRRATAVRAKAPPRALVGAFAGVLVLALVVIALMRTDLHQAYDIAHASFVAAVVGIALLAALLASMVTFSVDN